MRWMVLSVLQVALASTISGDLFQCCPHITNTKQVNLLQVHIPLCYGMMYFIAYSREAKEEKKNFRRGHHWFRDGQVTFSTRARKKNTVLL